MRRENAFPRNSDSEYSACPCGLLTYIILPCTPSPLASRCQLAPSAPSPLAHELTHAAAAFPVAACECRHRQPVSPASPGPLRYARCPPPPPPPPLCFLTPLPRGLRKCRRRRQPVPPASPAPRYIRCRHRRFCFPHPPQPTREPPLLSVVRAPNVPPPVRPTSLPPLLS
jgi:hypothetical protein